MLAGTPSAAEAQAAEAHVGRSLFQAALHLRDSDEEGASQQAEQNPFTELLWGGAEVKNTFIHVNVPHSMESIPSLTQPKKFPTAPAIVQEKSFKTRPGEAESIEQAHYEGRCKPCAYHYYKPDGCRQGDQCPFCHLCTRGEIRRRKKEKVRILRLQAGNAVAAAGANVAAAGANVAQFVRNASEHFRASSPEPQPLQREQPQPTPLLMPTQSGRLVQHTNSGYLRTGRGEG